MGAGLLVAGGGAVDGEGSARHPAFTAESCSLLVMCDRSWEVRRKNTQFCFHEKIVLERKPPASHGKREKNKAVQELPGSLPDNRSEVVIFIATRVSRAPIAVRLHNILTNASGSDSISLNLHKSEEECTGLCPFHRQGN